MRDIDENIFFSKIMLLPAPACHVNDDLFNSLSHGYVQGGNGFRADYAIGSKALPHLESYDRLPHYRAVLRRQRHPHHRWVHITGHAQAKDDLWNAFIIISGPDGWACGNERPSAFFFNGPVSFERFF